MRVSRESIKASMPLGTTQSGPYEAELYMEI